MRYWAAILIWIAAGLTPVAAQGKSPSIVFDSVTKDAGTVTQGEMAKHVFGFRNGGAGVLEIISVEPS